MNKVSYLKGKKQDKRFYTNGQWTPAGKVLIESMNLNDHEMRILYGKRRRIKRVALCTTPDPIVREKLKELRSAGIEFYVER